MILVDLKVTQQAFMFVNALNFQLPIWAQANKREKQEAWH